MPVRSGEFTTPVIGEFGAWRKNGRHNGWDQYAPEGTPIYAAGNGVVIKIAYNPDPNLGFGHNVTVCMDADRFEITDAHMLTTPSVVLGERVTSLTRVGYVGKSGNAVRVGSHDHVQIRKPNGLIVNPREYLATLAPAGLKPKPLQPDRRLNKMMLFHTPNTGTDKATYPLLYWLVAENGARSQFTSGSEFAAKVAGQLGNSIATDTQFLDIICKRLADSQPAAPTVGKVTLDASALVAELRALGVKIDALPAEIDRYADGKKQS